MENRIELLNFGNKVFKEINNLEIPEDWTSTQTMSFILDKIKAIVNSI